METRLSHILTIIETLEEQVRTLKNLVQTEIANTVINPPSPNPTESPVLPKDAPVPDSERKQAASLEQEEESPYLQPAVVDIELPKKNVPVPLPCNPIASSSNPTPFTKAEVEAFTTHITFKGLPNQPRRRVLRFTTDKPFTSREKDFRRQFAENERKQRERFHNIYRTREQKVAEARRRAQVWIEEETRRRTLERIDNKNKRRR
jgi:hypothetical protein